MHSTLTHPQIATARVAPGNVLAELDRHVLTDGFKIVVDLERSRGCRMVDAATGRQLLDLYSFFASMPVGFNHPYFDRPDVQADLLVAARTKVANSDVYSVQYATFVETFARVVGLPPLERYFFIEGGALAVENALKAAMDWKVRKNLAAGQSERGTEILHFRGAFHGRSGYTMSLTNTDPRKTDLYAKFNWPRVSAPCIDFTLPEPRRTADVAERERQSEAEIRRVLDARAIDVAAIIIETIQGEGGDRHFRREWFQTLRRLADQYDLLLIFDEVQSGMGITGRTWACEHFEVLPDLMVFGKKSQVCGVMAGPRLDQVKENVFRLPSRINSTWGGNFCDMVRSTHCLRVIESEKLVANAAAMGERLAHGLERVAATHPMVSEVRGRGLMRAFSLADTATRDDVWRRCFEAGLLTLRSGERSIRFRPVLDVTADVIDEAMGVLDEALRRAASTQRKG
ncbi:MAG: L-lysine 6-transaminase [Phycisphaerae bacterium]